MYKRIAFLLASILAFALVAGVASAVSGTPDTETMATAVVDTDDVVVDDSQETAVPPMTDVEEPDDDMGDDMLVDDEEAELDDVELGIDPEDDDESDHEDDDESDHDDDDEYVDRF